MNEENYYQGEIFDYKNDESNSSTIKEEKKLFFSYSQMSLYRECPLKYKFKYIDKLPEKPKPYFAFGQAIHSALEFFHSKLPPPSYPELIDFFSANWHKKNYAEKGYKNPEMENMDFQKGEVVLKKYWLKHKDERTLPFLCEYKGCVEVDGLEVVVIVDRIEYLGNGKIKIIDYKTGKEGKRNSDQLYMYQKILEMDKELAQKIKDKLKEDVDRVEVENMLYYYVENLKEVSFKRADDWEIMNFWKKVLDIVENIKENKFEPNPGEMQCNYCDFKSKCPIFVDTFRPKKYKPEKNGNLKENMKKYAEISLEIEKMKKELTRLESELNDFFERNSLDYEDEDYKIKLEKKEKLEITDRQELINFLKEEKIYEKTLRPTLQSIIDLLEDETIDEMIKKKLEKMIIRKYYIVSDILKKNGL